MHEGQRNTLKELIIAPLLGTIIDAYPNKDEEAESSIKSAFNTYLHPNQEDSEDLKQAITQLHKLYFGEVNLTTTFAAQTPSLDELRIAILDITIELLHEHFPNRRSNYPILQPSLDLEGMAKVRHLFVQYINNTSGSDSLECRKLALEILVEKLKLGLPSIYEAGTNPFYDMSYYGPGDFSHLDLSHLYFKRADDKMGGNFKALKLNNCNLDGCTFENIQLYEADLSASSLRGVDFSRSSAGTEAKMINYEPESIILNDADVSGAFFGKDYIADQKSKNSHLIAKNRDELSQYRQNHFPGKTVPVSEPPSIGEDSNNNNNPSESQSSSVFMLASLRNSLTETMVSENPKKTAKEEDPNNNNSQVIKDLQDEVKRLKAELAEMKDDMRSPKRAKQEDSKQDPQDKETKCLIM